MSTRRAQMTLTQIEQQLYRMRDSELSALAAVVGAEQMERDPGGERSPGVPDKDRAQAPSGKADEIVAALKARAKNMTYPNTLGLGLMYERVTGCTSATPEVEQLLRQIVLEELRRCDPTGEICCGTGGWAKLNGAGGGCVNADVKIPQNAEIIFPTLGRA
jgi:hypothetical protein